MIIVSDVLTIIGSTLKMEIQAKVTWFFKPLFLLRTSLYLIRVLGHIFKMVCALGLEPANTEVMFVGRVTNTAIVHNLIKE